uniref:Uncharacterized protein n=1 Tax=Denticeps clupeoides TaxID=299321 RepID=A0AAY4A055_9TELE
MNHSESLLVQSCHGGWSQQQLQASTIGPQGGKGLALPLGHEGAEETLRKTFSALRNYDLPAGLQTLRCRECVVVGNGGILQGSRLGAYIDQYDIIIRMNNAPVTTIRLLYGTGVPEHGCGGSGLSNTPEHIIIVVSWMFWVLQQALFSR